MISDALLANRLSRQDMW